MPVHIIRKDNIGKIKDAIHKRLAYGFEKKLNLHVEVGSARFNPMNMTVQVTLSVIDGKTKIPNTPQHQMFELVAKEYGLSPKLLDKTFYIGDGKNGKVVGYKYKAAENKFVILDQDGQRRACSFTLLKKLVMKDKRVAKFVIDPNKVIDYQAIVGNEQVAPGAEVKRSKVKIGNKTISEIVVAG